MNKIFNSPFEAGLRSLLVLYTMQPKTATVDRITAYDFITIYSSDFEITEQSLHGNNHFNFSELASKRNSCDQGLKEFALNGLISVHRNKQGFTYGINNTGKAYVESLSSDYAQQYLEIILLVHDKFRNISDEDLLRLINKKAIEELRR